jgi:hypothetical protein
MCLQGALNPTIIPHFQQCPSRSMLCQDQDNGETADFEKF